MKEIFSRTSKHITIAELYESHREQKYSSDKIYQLEIVWSEKKKSLTISSILKNFPIHRMIFRQIIDEYTGKYSYDVIEGKQQLGSIIEFIENKIPVFLEESSNDINFEKSTVGFLFKDFDDNDYLKELKKQFWRYEIPAEYIDTDSDDVIEAMLYHIESRVL